MTTHDRATAREVARVLPLLSVSFPVHGSQPDMRGLRLAAMRFLVIGQERHALQTRPRRMALRKEPSLAPPLIASRFENYSRACLPFLGRHDLRPGPGAASPSPIAAQNQVIIQLFDYALREFFGNFS